MFLQSSMRRCIKFSEICPDLFWQQDTRAGGMWCGGSGGMKVTVSSLSNNSSSNEMKTCERHDWPKPSQARADGWGLHHARSDSGVGNMRSGERRGEGLRQGHTHRHREYDHRTHGKIGQYSIERDSWIMSWIHSTFLYMSRVLPDMTLSRNLRPNPDGLLARMLMIRVFVKHRSRFRKLNFPFCSPSLYWLVIKWRCPEPFSDSFAAFRRLFPRFIIRSHRSQLRRQAVTGPG